MPKETAGGSPFPKQFFRLVVRAETDQDGGYTLSRDLTIERTVNPLSGTWTPGPIALMAPVAEAILYVRWCESIGVPVVYDPPGNLAGYFRRRRQDQPTLFDVGEVRE